MKKIIGYILSAAGFISLLLTFPGIKSYIPLNLPEGLTNTVLLILAAALIIIGLFFLRGRSTSKKQKISQEVPIYEGNNVVGYRRQN